MTPLAQQLAAALPPLVMAARQVAGAVAGGHGRRRAGPGDGFWQFRPAQPGDEGRLIDWRQSARSDHLQVRETQWLAAQHLHLWCESGPGMEWRSNALVPPKSQRALVLALALALVVWRGGDRVAALGHRRMYGREGQLPDLALDLGEGCGLAATPLLRPRHRVVLFSDGWQPLDQWRQRLQLLTAQGVRGHLVQVLDPAEQDFPFTGRVRFLAVDGEESVLAERAEAWQIPYGARLAGHQQDLTHLAQDLGWSLLTHRTDHAPAQALLALYHHLALEAP